MPEALHTTMYEFVLNGTNPNTGRRNKLTVRARHERGAMEAAEQKGLVGPFEIIDRRDPEDEPASAEQFAYARDLGRRVGITLPANATKGEAGDLIDRVKNEDKDPNPGLIEYAVSMGIRTTNYTGKMALYNRLFFGQDLSDRVRFFVFCVYRWISDDRYANLLTHPLRERLEAVADQLVGNERFVKSMNRYNGAELRYFGESKYGVGGSTGTIAYKAAVELLREEFPNLQSQSLPSRVQNDQPVATVEKLTFAEWGIGIAAMLLGLAIFVGVAWGLLRALFG